MIGPKTLIVFRGEKERRKCSKLDAADDDDERIDGKGKKELTVRVR